MSRKKVLFVLHNHPSLGPGGAEAYALNLFRALRESGDYEPLVVARASPDNPRAVGAHWDASFTAIGDSTDEFLVFVREHQYEKLFMRSLAKRLLARDWADFLRAHAPDVVHFQHTLFIGCDLISTVRRTLPKSPIVYTLQEYVPICHHYGQLVRTEGRGLCLEASPRRCNECFPAISPQQFFLRKRFIQAHFSHVDLFIAPSRFLLERYVDWGIPRERIRFEDYGFPAASPLPSTEDRPRNRFGFFGVLTPFKGADVLLRAMELLGPKFEGRLTIHGANYEHQPEEVQAELDGLFERTRATVTRAGPYDHDADLPRLMSEIDWVVVPSVWWENSPLVIREAFQHGRPVICSDIGGMAEKVEHQVSGLQFNVANPAALAATLESAVTMPGLWQQLREGIPPVPTMERHVAELNRIYTALIERRNGAARAERSAEAVPG
jgi:glycosyltransferase involved in cell wall biosynthesis